MVAKKIILYISVIAVLFSVLVVPVAAADPELYYQDILLDAVYSCYDDDRLVSSTKETPTHFFSGSTTAKFQWDARHYDRTYSSIIYTVFFSVDPGIDNVISEFHHYNGRVTKASAVQLDTYYYQFRVDRTSNMSWPAIEFTFTKAYSGTISILSCYGIRDIGINIDKVSFQQGATMIKTGSAILDTVNVISEVGSTLPVGHMSKRQDQYQTWYHDTVFIYGNFEDISTLDSLSFMGYGLTPDIITFSLLDSTGWPVFSLDPEESATKISTSIPSWGDHDWDVIFWQIDVDLSGYDLSDCYWELSFQLEPLIYKSGWSFTDWHLEKIIARLPVENTPWYKTFFSWLSVKWDNIAGQTNGYLKEIARTIKDIAGNATKETLEQIGEEVVGSANEAIPNQSAEFVQSFDSLKGSFSYEGTQALLPIPALTMPAIAGIIPETVLFEGGSVDFESFVEFLPDGLLLLVRSLCTIALIIYCFKELYDTIAYVLTLRKAG